MNRQIQNPLGMNKGIAVEDTRLRDTFKSLEINAELVRRNSGNEQALDAKVNTDDTGCT